MYILNIFIYINLHKFSLVIFHRFTSQIIADCVNEVENATASYIIKKTWKMIGSG